MPDIKEDNVLLSLCHQIEESEILQYKLERLLDDRSEELAKNRSSKKMLTILCVVLLLSTLMLLIYTIFSTRDKEIMVENNDLSLFRSDINILKGDLEELKKNDTNIKNLKDLYLYRSLIKKDTVYSV